MSRSVNVDDAVLSLLEFEGGAIGLLEASRFAMGRKNSLEFEMNGDRGAFRFSWDRRDWLEVCDESDRLGGGGFGAVQCGPETPLGKGFWPIPGIGFGFLETAIIQVREFLRALRGERSVAANFAEGLRVEYVLAALEASASAGGWVEVPCD